MSRVAYLQGIARVKGGGTIARGVFQGYGDGGVVRGQHRALEAQARGTVGKQEF